MSRVALLVDGEYDSIWDRPGDVVSTFELSNRSGRTVTWQLVREDEVFRQEVVASGLLGSGITLGWVAEEGLVVGDDEDYVVELPMVSLDRLGLALEELDGL